MTLQATQKEVFLESEGDQWYRRNAAALAAASTVRDLAAQTIAPALPKGRPAQVLEIGCGRGDNLAALEKLGVIEGHGIEPSAEAVRAGASAFPQFQLLQGTADALPHADGSMDIVWFGFCLYLVDRSLLMLAVAEADRVLRDGGAVAIIDFDPSVPTARGYHHRQGLCSYKMDYSKLFLANPAYTLADKRAASHAGPGWTVDAQERLGIWLCVKDSASAYAQS
jgi:ubiquinone/menaquinone biosynthesis C-methylase UbiE